MPYEKKVYELRKQSARGGFFTGRVTPMQIIDPTTRSLVTSFDVIKKDRFSLASQTYPSGRFVVARFATLAGAKSDGHIVKIWRTSESKAEFGSMPALYPPKGEIAREVAFSQLNLRTTYYAMRRSNNRSGDSFTKAYLVTDCHPGAELWDFVYSRDPKVRFIKKGYNAALHLPVFCQWMLSIAYDLKVILDTGHVFSDLKAENIVVSQTGSANICDGGSFKEANSTTETSWSPETCSQHRLLKSAERISKGRNPGRHDSSFHWVEGMHSPTYDWQGRDSIFSLGVVFGDIISEAQLGRVVYPRKFPNFIPRVRNHSLVTLVSQMFNVKRYPNLTIYEVITHLKGYTESLNLPHSSFVDEEFEHPYFKRIACFYLNKHMGLSFEQARDLPLDKLISLLQANASLLRRDEGWCGSEWHSPGVRQWHESTFESNSHDLDVESKFEDDKMHSASSQDGRFDKPVVVSTNNELMPPRDVKLIEDKVIITEFLTSRVEHWQGDSTAADKMKWAWELVDYIDHNFDAATSSIDDLKQYLLFTHAVVERKRHYSTALFIVPSSLEAFRKLRFQSQDLRDYHDKIRGSRASVRRPVVEDSGKNSGMVI